MRMCRVAVFICLCLVTSCNTQYELYEGALCYERGVAGVCTNMAECSSAIDNLLHDRAPKICSFSGLDPVVCCFDQKPKAEASSRPQWTVPTPAPPETEEKPTTEEASSRPQWTFPTPAAPDTDKNPTTEEASSRPQWTVTTPTPPHTDKKQTTEEESTRPQWTVPTPAPPETEKKPTTEEASSRPQWTVTTPAPPDTTVVARFATKVATSSVTPDVSTTTVTTPRHSAPPGDCPPISPNNTAAKTGQKAWDKCIEYHEQLVMPCDVSSGKRSNYCLNDLNTWILNGEDAYEGEFPHMALVGYGSEQENLSFLCGGTLISDRFVMTAGHCASARDLGPISYVLLGILKRSQFAAANLHAVRAVHKHPNYKPPKKYHDIALLQLANPVTLSYQLVPACLDVGGMSDAPVATATGWGTTQYKGVSVDILQKVNLARFTTEECGAKYQPTRLMPNGYDNRSQICYGDKTMSKDTCQGDSGGPLQVRHERVYCMYSVIGITSLGRLCGVPGEPALYTRVAHYVPWIEAIVWPDQ